MRRDLKMFSVRLHQLTIDRPALSSRAPQEGDAAGEALSVPPAPLVVPTANT
jgi:hypothetical protein